MNDKNTLVLKDMLLENLVYDGVRLRSAIRCFVRRIRSLTVAKLDSIKFFALIMPSAVMERHRMPVILLALSPAFFIAA